MVWHGDLEYIDDIIVYDRTWAGSLEKLAQVLERLRRANLKLKAKKCFLFCQEVEYLGHLVSGDGVRPLRGKVAALQHWATPANVDELRSFLGLACYYKHFIGDYSKHAAPLNLLTRKDTPFIRGEQQREAFVILKNALPHSPALAQFSAMVN